MRWMVKRPLTSYTRRKFSDVLSMVMTSWKPAGKLESVLTFPSTLTRRCWRMAVTSRLFKAYLRRFLMSVSNSELGDYLRKRIKGRDSRPLCGPGEANCKNTRDKGCYPLVHICRKVLTVASGGELTTPRFRQFPFKSIMGIKDHYLLVLLWTSTHLVVVVL